MSRIIDFFSVPQALTHPIPQVQVVGAVQNLGIANNEGCLNNQVQ